MFSVVIPRLKDGGIARYSVVGTDTVKTRFHVYRNVITVVSAISRLPSRGTRYRTSTVP